MTQHPSLRSGEKGKQHRSVLKRFERLKHLKEKNEWEEDMSIFGLPKIKVLKFKIKKEKAAPAEEGAAGAEGAPAAAGAPAKGPAGGQAKGPAGAHAAAKPQEAKGQAKGAPPKPKEEKGKK